MEVASPHKLSYAGSLLRARVCHLHQRLSKRQPPPGDVNRAPPDSNKAGFTDKLSSFVTKKKTEEAETV